ncbi:RNA-binding protein [Patescibacteria group bacterium]|nr:RNA-binding protein [Patescibacteria group bacterium]
MENKIFVGGLPWAVDNDKLREIFSAYGEIKDAHVATDKFTGKSRGFGFVEFNTNEEAQAAIDALNETELEGRTITVNVARPKER